MELLFGLFAGLAAGSVFALLGAGLVIAYRGSGVINFAHGSVAAYAAFTWDELRDMPGPTGIGNEGGSIHLPWFDPIPEWGFLKALHINNLPVEIHIMNDPPACEKLTLRLGYRSNIPPKIMEHMALVVSAGMPTSHGSQYFSIFSVPIISQG